MFQLTFSVSFESMSVHSGEYLVCKNKAAAAAAALFLLDFAAPNFVASSFGEKEKKGKKVKRASR